METPHVTVVGDAGSVHAMLDVLDNAGWGTAFVPCHGKPAKAFWMDTGRAIGGLEELKKVVAEWQEEEKETMAQEYHDTCGWLPWRVRA